jgi:hypothetical protein
LPARAYNDAVVGRFGPHRRVRHAAMPAQNRGEQRLPLAPPWFPGALWPYHPRSGATFTGLSAMPRSSSRLAGRRVDYNSVQNRYQGVSFGGVTKPKHRRLALQNHGAPGRANAAPPLTSWPLAGQHSTVTYVPDISASQQWTGREDDQVLLPFRDLDINHNVRWQGLIQEVGGLENDAKARDHFDEISHVMETNGKQTVVTECVGEAAAAICLLTNAKFNGFQMQWGYDNHSGTGIDQIWKKGDAKQGYDYLIVEAKGPGASLNPGTWVPPGFAQMEEGWVLNHLRSMQNNLHAIGMEMVQELRLAFACAHPNYNGSATSYYGLSAGSKHKQSASRLHGVVVTAKWLSDGRLWYSISNEVQYLL